MIKSNVCPKCGTWLHPTGVCPNFDHCEYASTQLTVEQINKVIEKVAEAKGVAWDHCHKIYLSMDEEDVNRMTEYEYEVFLVNSYNKQERAELVLHWYSISCPLRFISAVSTVEDDPNKGFENVVAQFEYTDAEDIEEDE
jgi:hypothetical protein